MSDAVFKRKYTSANSYKDRRRRLEKGSEAVSTVNASTATASPSTSKIRSKMQTRTESMGDLNDNHTLSDTPIIPAIDEDCDYCDDSSDDKAIPNSEITPVEAETEISQERSQSGASTLSKRTYAKVRSYRNDAPIDEAAGEGYGEMRKKWGVDDSDDEDDEEPSSTHKSFSQLRSTGVSKRNEEELSYICDGFIGESPTIRRSSGLSVSQKLSNHDWKRWLVDSEECLDRVWMGVTRYMGNGDAIFDAIAAIIIAHLAHSNSHTASPLASLSPSFCSSIRSLYHNNNSSDVFRMSDRFLSRSERPLLREVKAAAESAFEMESNGEITVPRLLLHAVDGIGEYVALQDYADVVHVALDAFDRTRVVVEEVSYIMRLMKVVERSADAASFAMLKKLAVVFGWMAAQDEKTCSRDYIKSTTRAMVTLSVERRELARHVFVTGGVARDTLTHLSRYLSQRNTEEHTAIITLLLGLLMNLIELGGEVGKGVAGIADVFKEITKDDTIAQIFNMNHSQLNNETDVGEMSDKVVLCTLTSCILSNCMINIPEYQGTLRTQVNLQDTTKVLRLNEVLDDSHKARVLVEKVEGIVNRN